MFIAIVFFFDLGYMLVNCGRLLISLKWAAILSTVDQYMVLFCYCLLAGDTAMLGGLHARFSTHLQLVQLSSIQAYSCCMLKLWVGYSII